MRFQFNGVNQENLIDERLRPERYKELIVRISGYCDYFFNLAESLRDDIIARCRFEKLEQVPYFPHPSYIFTSFQNNRVVWTTKVVKKAGTWRWIRASPEKSTGKGERGSLRSLPNPAKGDGGSSGFSSFLGLQIGK